jgi:UDP-N-acetylmuramoyl-tripeptide--D-alanyl-D-alanine ligase
MELALEAFQTIATLNSCVILGDMLELGNTSKKEHEAIIVKCLENKIQNIHLVGSHFLDTNNVDSKITKHKDLITFLKFIESSSLNFDRILIKGSRSIKLEDILPFLKSGL